MGLENIIVIPRILGGILSAFLAIITLRIVYPIVSTIWGLGYAWPIMQAVAYLIFWSILFSVFYFGVFMQFWKPKQEEINQIGEQ